MSLAYENAPPLRLLVVSKTLDVGGAERLIVDAARRWKGPIEVAWLSGVGELEAELRETGCVVHDLSVGRGRIGFRTILALRALLRSGRFDLAHVHLPIAGVLVRILAGSLPIVYSEHNVWETYSPITRWLNRLTFARNTQVVAVSEDVLVSVRRGWHVALPVVAAVPNGITPRVGPSPDRLAIRAREGVPEDTVVLLNVANLFQRKGQDLLIKAIARLTRGNPRVVAWIAGEGDSRRTLERLIADHGLAASVRLLGRRNDVHELMSAADIFVMPSRYEGLPVALLEAMDSGLPAVASRIGGMPDALRGAGIIVAPEDSTALASALETLIRDPALREAMGAAARSSVAERFSASRMDAALLEIYRKAVAGATPISDSPRR